jgi:predicted cupin superfamily sugar epimerase
MKVTETVPDSARALIDRLDLQPHPEGGWFKETYRADAAEGERASATGIYFLLTSENVSNFHRIDSDEMWHFYAGDPLTVHMIDETGKYSALSIGPDFAAGQVFQAVVPAGVWFGSSVDVTGGWALVGCTVSPGFEFSGFELADRAALTAEFPAHKQIIKRLTRDETG